MRALAVTLAFALAPACAAARSCLEDAGHGRAPRSYDELRVCQDKARAAAIAAAKKQGRPLTSAQLDALDSGERAQARWYFAHAPVIEGGPAAARTTSASAGSGAVPDWGSAARLDARTASSIAGLQARLKAEGGDGSRGITPEMAADIAATLQQEQGGMSGDMRQLLDAVSRDGGKLTPGTMKLLQGAARQAKAQGMNLNIDPNTENEILNHDFDSDQQDYNRGSSASPGSM